MKKLVILTAFWVSFIILCSYAFAFELIYEKKAECFPGEVSYMLSKQEVKEAVLAWLKTKGVCEEGQSSIRFPFNDGRFLFNDGWDDHIYIDIDIEGQKQPNGKCKVVWRTQSESSNIYSGGICWPCCDALEIAKEQNRLWHKFLEHWVVPCYEEE